MEKILKQFIDEVKQIDDEERSIVHIITAETTDRQGDVVRSKGMDDENFAKNPVVMFGHDYSSFPVGKNLWRKTATRNGVKCIIAKTQFADTPEGIKTFDLWKNGFLNAASIGFIGKKSEVIRSEDGQYQGRDFKEWELLEYSIVPVPANAAATRLSLEDMPELMAKAFEPALKEQRLAELEAQNADALKSIAERVKEIEELSAMLKARDAELEELTHKINELTQPQPKKTVGISADELASLVDAVTRREISRMMGKVSI